ncbi:hypothetical protein GOC14_07140 [Sinorhizobium meliloti]|nr:hypothetical protein [Sinorhizobium meliloti]
MDVKRRAVTTRTQWLEWRRQYLCASEVGAASGFDEFRTALSVYAEKAGLIMNSPDSPLLRRGRNFERAAIAYLSEDYPDWRIVQPHVFLFNDEFRIACTPDAIVEAPEHKGPVNCQIKTVARPSFEKWDGVPPTAYSLQVATENMLIDAAHGILAVLVVGDYSAEIEIFDIPRHEAAEAKIREFSLEFWANLESGKFPPPDFKRDHATIAAMNATGEPDSVIDLSGDNLLGEVLERREALKAEIDQASEELDALTTEIRHKMGAFERGDFPGWKITLKEQVRKSYVVPEWSGRVLRVRREKEK